ncbi:MAG: peroxidase family protein [Saprospiraceae bacterium]
MRKYFTIIFILLISITVFAQNTRQLNGIQNNLNNPNWGAANTNFIWSTTVDYADEISTPSGANRPSAREISNLICHQDSFMANEKGLSDFVWTWGQFLDHDIMLSISATPAEIIPIQVPLCDPEFDPNCTGTVTIPLRRAEYDPATGTSVANPRTHVNRTTSYIDASAVYGTEPFRLAWMRTYQDGRMKTSIDNLLPYNTVTGKLGAVIDPNAPPMDLAGGFPQKHFISGDVRANEQPTLTSLHVLFLREHNRICDEIKQLQPTWTDEQIFQRARKVVGAMIQVITYEEFLPAIGVELPPYQNYDATLNAGIMNSFSGAAFRFGHSAVTGTLVRYDEDDVFSFGSVDIRSAFANPTFLQDEGGIEPFLRGLAAQKHQHIDTKITSDLRNFLFGQPGSGGMDLAALNIERGREKGLPHYNLLRQNFALSPVNSFSDITSDIVLQQQLQQLYGTVDSIDAWIGLLSEDHVPNSIFGPCMVEMIRSQFEYLRDGDRLYYENDPTFSALELTAIKQTRLAHIIRRNTDIITIQDSVFYAQERDLVSVELLPFQQIRRLELDAYPNPTQKYFTIRMNAVRNGSGTLLIIDGSGRVVREEQLNIVTGENQFKFELDDDLASGLYSIMVNINGDRGNLKILKLGN